MKYSPNNNELHDQTIDSTVNAGELVKHTASGWIRATSGDVQGICTIKISATSGTIVTSGHAEIGGVSGNAGDDLYQSTTTPYNIASTGTTKIGVKYISSGPSYADGIIFSVCCGSAVATTAPVMGGVGTTTVGGVGTNTATLQGTYTSDGGSTITATGFVVYPSGTSPYTIGSPFVMQYPDATLPSPINATPTNLAPTTDYCARPYAVNAIGTSYGEEICFTTNAVGYVTNLSSNNISLINMSSFTNVGSISGISSPLAGFIDDGYMYVGGGSNFITRIYLGDNSITSLNLGAQVGPMIADATHVYVGTGGTNTLHKINKATFTVDATLGGLSDNQSGVIVGGFLYVNGQASGTVYKIDLSTFTIASSILTGASGAHRIATDGTYLYVTHYISNVLVRIDISTFTVAGSIGGFSTPYGIAIDGGFAYVGNNSGGTVSKINLSTFSSVGTVGVGSGPRYPLVKSGFLYMPCDSANRVDKINLSTFTNVGNVGVGTFPCQFMIQQ